MIAWTDTGQLALWDSATGEAIDQTALPSQARPPGARDVAWDRFRQRAVLFESDEEEQAGELGTVAVTGLGGPEPGLGIYQHRAWVDGRARLWPVQGGIVVFEEGYGERWKLLRDDAVPTASIAAPRPASAWSELEPDGSRVEALSYGPSGSPPAFQLVRAWATREGLDGLCTEPLGVVPQTVPLSARLAPLPTGSSPAAAWRGMLVDLRAGVPVLRLVGLGGASEAVQLTAGPLAERIEQVVALPGVHQGDRRGLAALLSRPSRLLVSSFDPALDDVRTAVVALVGQTRIHDRFFARDLLAIGSHRLLVATSAGAWAADITFGESRLHATLDVSFDGRQIRGPLAGPVRRLHPLPPGQAW